MKKIFISGKLVNYFKKSFLQLLLTFFGLNWSSLLFISGIIGLHFKFNIKDIPFIFITFLNNVLKLNFLILKILFKKYVFIIRAEKRLGSYRGLRLKLGLPAHGQRTHSNAKTSRNFFFNLK